jgi:two-component system LytT family response regulator
VTTLKTLVVDDERLARQRLSRLLRAEPDVEVVATCRSARQARDVLAGGPVDVLFTDVQMPRASGFELLRLAVPADGAASPLVVFVTAFEQYAVQAFEVSACDYLLKPVTEARVRTAVRRARDRLGRSAIASDLDPEAGRTGAGTRGDAVLVRTDACVLRVPIETIDSIEAAGNYVTLHAGGRSHLLRETLAAFEARLPPGRFARIHRAAIVNVDRIVAFEPTPSGDFDVALREGRRVRMSRTYRNRIRDLFGRPV